MRLLVVAVVLCLVAGGVGLWIGSTVKSPAQIAAETQAPPQSHVTTMMESRSLADELRISGFVRAGVETSLSASAGGEGEGVVTRRSTEVGDMVNVGSLLGEVDGRPVFATEGVVPVYRSIRGGDSGADVEQLQANLVELGYLDAVSGVFDAASQEAVRQMYATHGYEPLVVEDELPAAIDAVDIARRLVADAEGVLSQASEGSRVAVVSAGAELDSARADLAAIETNTDLNIQEAKDRAKVAANTLQKLQDSETATDDELSAATIAKTEADNALVRAEADATGAVEAAKGRVKVAETALTDSQTAPNIDGETRALQAARSELAKAERNLSEVRGRSGVVLPRSELVSAEALPANLVAADLNVGQAAGSPTWTISSGRPLVESYVSTAQQGLIEVGDEVAAVIAGESVLATVESIERTLSISPSGFEGHRMLVQTDTPLDGSLIGRSVDGVVTAKATQGDVLAVLVAAVHLGDNGDTFLVTNTLTGDRRVHDVEIGASAGGFVEIIPAGEGESELQPGIEVMLALSPR